MPPVKVPPVNVPVSDAPAEKTGAAEKVWIPEKVLAVYVFGIVVEEWTKYWAEVVENAAPVFWVRKYDALVVEKKKPLSKAESSPSAPDERVRPVPVRSVKVSPLTEIPEEKVWRSDQVFVAYVFATVDEELRYAFTRVSL